MDSFSDELRTEFGVQLENSHAIDKSQLMVNVIQCTLDKKPLNFVYKRRSDFEQAVSLGQFIQSMEKNIPGGILIFFASYESM